MKSRARRDLTEDFNKAAEEEGMAPPAKKSHSNNAPPIEPIDVRPTAHLDMSRKRTTTTADPIDRQASADAVFSSQPDVQKRQRKEDESPKTESQTPSTPSKRRPSIASVEYDLPLQKSDSPSPESLASPKFAESPRLKKPGRRPSISDTHPNLNTLLSRTTDQLALPRGPEMSPLLNNLWHSLKLRSNGYKPLYFIDHLPGAIPGVVEEEAKKPTQYQYINSSFAAGRSQISREFGANGARPDRFVLCVGADGKLYADRFPYMCIPQIALAGIKTVEFKVCEFVKLSADKPELTPENVSTITRQNAASGKQLPIYILHQDRLYYHHPDSGLEMIKGGMPQKLAEGLKLDKMEENIPRNLTAHDIEKFVIYTNHDPQHVPPFHAQPPAPVEEGFYVYVLVKRKPHLATCPLHQAYELRMIKLTPSDSGHTGCVNRETEEVYAAGEIYINKAGKICIINDKTGSFFEEAQQNAARLHIPPNELLLKRIFPADCFVSNAVVTTWNKSTVMDIKTKILAPLRNQIFEFLRGSFEDEIPEPAGTLESITQILNDEFDKFQKRSFADDEARKEGIKLLIAQVLKQIYIKNSTVEENDLNRYFHVDSPEVAGFYDFFIEALDMFKVHNGYHKKYNDLLLAQEVIKVGLDDYFLPRDRKDYELRSNVDFMPVTLKEVTSEANKSITDFLKATLKIEFENDHYTIIEEVLVSHCQRNADGSVVTKDILKEVSQRISKEAIQLNDEHQHLLTLVDATIQKLIRKLKTLNTDYATYEKLYLLKDLVLEKYAQPVTNISPVKQSGGKMPPAVLLSKYGNWSVVRTERNSATKPEAKDTVKSVPRAEPKTP